MSISVAADSHHSLGDGDHSGGEDNEDMMNNGTMNLIGAGGKQRNSTNRNLDSHHHNNNRQEFSFLGNVFNGLMDLISPSAGNRRNYRNNNAFDEQLSSDEMDELLETNDVDEIVPSSKSISVFNHHVLFSIYGFNVLPDRVSEYRLSSEWEQIPRDVLLIVFSFLPFESLITSVSQVSKEWLFLSQQNILWEKFFVEQLFPSKHAKFIFSSFQSSKYLPEIDKKENLLESIQSRFYIPLFDPNPNATDNERFGEGDIEEEKRREIKIRIEEEIEAELEDKFKEQHYNLKSILGNKTITNVGGGHNTVTTAGATGSSEINRYEREFYTLLHAPYICSFYKLCYQKLNNFVSTATKQLESHNKGKEQLENMYEMCHNTQYYFTFFLGVPISTVSATVCLILQLIKMNVKMFSVTDRDDPNAIDGYWMLSFAFLYPPLFCGIIVLFQQFTKAFLRFKLKSRQTVQGVLVVLIGLIFMFGLTGFFFMVNLSCIFPLPPKYLGDEVPGNSSESIKFYAFRRIVNNYSFIMSPFLIAFLLIAIVSWISQSITLYAAFGGNRRQLIIRNVINSALHLFFCVLVGAAFVLLHYSQKADSSPDDEDGLVATISYIVIGMHVLIAIMHVATCLMFAFILKQFCTLFTPLAKRPKMKKLGIGLMITVVLLSICSLALEVMMGVDYRLFSLPLIPTPTLLCVGFYIVAAMYRLWIS